MNRSVKSTDQVSASLAAVSMDAFLVIQGNSCAWGFCQHVMYGTTASACYQGIRCPSDRALLVLLVMCGASATGVLANLTNAV